METSSTIKEYLSIIGKRGGQKTRRLKGKKHYSAMGKKSAEIRRKGRLSTG